MITTTKTMMMTDAFLLLLLVVLGCLCVCVCVCLLLFFVVVSENIRSVLSVYNSLPTVTTLHPCRPVK